ncbi:bZIP transcription factor TRAB1-like [Phragmites australis]|uniref:bZIP transcription factor TRAB1-like n=1 Tax=Phragmites australis TaxID=29695 RepID=UPI002D78717B|nr:bZIP transcription factor TRAB1-like [Phragmites australis]
MAAMDMEDGEDIWVNTTSPSPIASRTQPATAAAAASSCSSISTQHSLNSHIHLLSSAAAAAAGAHCSPPHSSGADGICAAGGIRHHMGLGGGFRNAAAFPVSFFSYSLNAAAARSALEDEMCLGPDASATWAGAGVGGDDRRKKRMIKNRESAARSRARKQAYILELEREVQLLQQENESLRVKYEQLRVSVEVPVPMKKTLQRTPSAPF